MKDINNYEGRYAITEDGQVWSYARKKFMSAFDNGHGYLCVGLIDASGKRKVHKVPGRIYEGPIGTSKAFPLFQGYHCYILFL